MKLGPIELKLNRRSKTRVREFGGYGGIEYMGDLIIQIEALLGTSTNRYVTRAAQVDETIRKYRGQAAKGNILVRNILETRSAFTTGRGLNRVGWDGEAEKEFVKAFFEANKLSLAYLRRLGRERCFEGQVLLILNPGSDHIPRVRFVSWYDTRYEVKASASDYSDIRWVRWLGDRRDVVVEPGRLAFMKFNIRLNSFEGTPLLAGILNQVENLDDALTIFKTVNTRASNPAPYFEFETDEAAEEDDLLLKG